MHTKQTMETHFQEYLDFTMMSDWEGTYVLNDDDYKKISINTTPEWKGQLVYFNVDGEDSYSFAHWLYQTLVSSFNGECAVSAGYDRAERMWANKHHETYSGDVEAGAKVNLEDCESADFREEWFYMPKFRIMDQKDRLRNVAITINNRYVFDDLGKLGASRDYLRREVRHQAGKVFGVPVAVGMIRMYLVYLMILVGNDGMVTENERAAKIACLVVLLVAAGIIHSIYKMSCKKMEKSLQI